MAFCVAKSEDGTTEVYFTPEQWRVLHDVTYRIWMDNVAARQKTLVDHPEEPTNRCLAPTGSYLREGLAGEAISTLNVRTRELLPSEGA